MDDTLVRTIFDKIEEESRLYDELSRGSAAYDFVLGMGDYQDHLAFAVAKLRGIVTDIRRSEDSDVAIAALKPFGFYLFAFGSAHLALENFLFLGAQDLGIADSVSPLIEAWKKAPAVQLVKAYRNRIQHRHYPLPALTVSARGPHHSEGPSWSAEFRLSTKELDRLLDEINAGLRPTCEQFVDQVMKDQPDGLFALFDAYAAALNDLATRMRDALKGSHSSQFEDMRDLVKRLDAARAWLIEHGVLNPMQRLADDLALPVRSW